MERVALAVSWCLQKARLFLLGCPHLTVVTDHRLLTKLLWDRALTDIFNPHLFRLNKRTLQYRFRVKYLPGMRNSVADFLSRKPALKADPSAHNVDLDKDLTDAIAAAVLAAVEHDSCVMDEASVRQVAVSDPVYQLFMARVLAGDWADRKSQEVACLRHFYGVRERLAVIQDLVTYTFEQGNVRLVIPETLRQQVAASLHAGHQGLDSLQRRRCTGLDSRGTCSITDLRAKNATYTHHPRPRRNSSSRRPQSTPSR
ncbi:uncharacterized protein [Palaemon carinicauda]|uniref:uncharacterized protein n=1 Tax=Palaemon carinicauda TaxID=392227 RepID=UPI0035B68B24